MSPSTPPSQRRVSLFQSSTTTVKIERDRDPDALLPALSRNRSLKRSRHNDDSTEAGRSPQDSKKGFSLIHSTKEEYVSPSPKKRKLKRTYADPSVYAHLRPVKDYLKVGLDIMFCGIKVNEYKPLIVCFVRVSIADTVTKQVLKAKAKEKKPKAVPGLLPFKVIHSDMSETMFYCVSSTSGRVVAYKKSDKVIQFKGLSDLQTAIKTRAFDSSDFFVVPAGVVEGKE
ncbi:hypothetical protein BKA70DRAFT_1430040 [Coprinopsis sp. MPI-PUGE-AT-0042]|nr:hypothetical protein BKA70DRAFT_1430010 [Coprinopsis sp. MPI-PUGE-AT-0042]KAH6906098.1 hypothetical protein BKA70DRAFT_1430040 [Coprinopsis sp. MPI-PUGE-AT-0042]